jgi:hypothetical protein
MGSMDPNWLSPDETPDGKWHYLVWVANTSGQYHVYLDGVKEATWIDKRPSHLDLWRVMVRRFGRWRRVRSLAYRVLHLIPEPKPSPDYGTPKGYSAEVLSDSPSAYWRFDEVATVDGATVYPSALGPDEVALRYESSDQ